MSQLPNNRKRSDILLPPLYITNTIQLTLTWSITNRSITMRVKIIRAIASFIYRHGQSGNKYGAIMSDLENLSDDTLFLIYKSLSNR